MAYSDNFPTQRAVFTLDAANAGRLDPRCSFSRASTGTYFGTEKVLSSENLLLQSQSFDTTWGLGPGHLTGTPSGGQTAPDGTSTAFLATATTSASSLTPYINQTPSLSASTTYTMVGHLKAGTATHGFISFRGSNGNSAYAMVNFSAGTVSHGSYGDFTSPSSSVTALGSSWFRVTLTATTGTTLSSQVAVIGISDGTTPSSAGYSSYVPSGETIYLWGAQLSSIQTKVYDSPTTTQISRSYQTKLQTAASGAARFEHSATDGQSAGTSLGCLIEGQSTNLATYGSDLTNAAWNPLSAFIGGTAVGPDGTLSAVKLVASAGSSLYPRFRRLSFLTSTTQTFSIYVKPLEFQHLAISADGSGSCLVQYNLSGSGAITSATGATGAVEQCGNGWFRVSFSYTTVPNANLAITMQSSTTYQAETGNGYDGMLFALAQLENQSFSSSFIGTTSSTATRAADRLEVDLTLVGNEVTVAAEAISTAVTSDRETVFHITPLNTSTVSAYAGRATGGGTNSVFYGGSSGVYLAGSTVTAGSAYKFALRTAPANHGMSYNGGTVATETTTVPPYDFDTLHIGSRSDGSNAINGHVKRIAVYNEALSDTNLQAITS